MTLQDYATHTYPAIREADFRQTMEQVVEPYLNERRMAAFLPRPDQHRVYTERYLPDAPAVGTVLISHGFTESCSKYHEMIYYFLQQQYAVVALDHRDHGRSRAVIDDAIPTRATRMTVFQDYVDDLQAVVEEYLNALPQPHLLYAHSMGGAIAATYLEQHPETFDRAVLNAPMLHIQSGGLPKWLAKAVSGALCALGKGDDFLPGQPKFSPDLPYESSCGNSPARYAYYLDLQKRRVELQSAGCSNRWANECLKACDRLLRPENCAKVQIPVLLFQAERDTLVEPWAQRDFIARIKNGTLLVVPGQRHEIHLGTDEVLPLYWGTIFDFFGQASR